ncbi:MAG: rhodanese-like domain-containing protein [Rhizobiaceae bacterium]|nr:rhodanese-like domain-containing protein [Rhizobiaceae bacterium]
MSYAGDLTVKQCWDLLGSDKTAFIVDVRTVAEWAYVGVPLLDAEMQDVILQQWQVFPDMAVDGNFSSRLHEQLESAGADKEAKLCFLCRSGVRSLAAAKAMSAIGYANSYNITGGFEGDLDDEGHRGKRNGWKMEGLPWQQR